MYANNLKKKLSRQSNTQSRKEFCAVMDEKKISILIHYIAALLKIYYTLVYKLFIRNLMFNEF